MRAIVIVSAVVIALSGCANPMFDVGHTETVLPLNRAWVEGRAVEYVTTDISDAAMARMMGVNFVPRLGQAAKSTPGNSLLERVYKFRKNEQISVFQSAPNPVGEDNQDLSYSPLWRLVLVDWIDPSKTRELKSEEEVLAAQDRKEVAIEVTDIVVNCPVTRSHSGQVLRGVR